MTGRNRHFMDAFKAEAMRFSHESGRTVYQVAQDLGGGIDADGLAATIAG